MKPDHPHDDRHAARHRTDLCRRGFLRGVGVSLALPAFESFASPRLIASAAGEAGALATAPSGAPLRMAFVYVPNGVHQGYWWPKGEGKSFELNKTIQPLEKVKDQIQILGGL